MVVLYWVSLPACTIRRREPSPCSGEIANAYKVGGPAAPDSCQSDPSERPAGTDTVRTPPAAPIPAKPLDSSQYFTVPPAVPLNIRFASDIWKYEVPPPSQAYMPLTDTEYIPNGVGTGAGGATDGAVGASDGLGAETAVGVVELSGVVRVTSVPAGESACGSLGLVALASSVGATDGRAAVAELDVPTGATESVVRNITTAFTATITTTATPISQY